MINKQLLQDWIYPILIIGTIILLFFKGCKSDKIEVNIPEKKGTFTTIKNPIPDTVEKKTIIYKWKTKTITVEKPVDTTLLNDYLSAKDSISRLNILLKASTLNDYTIFEDDSLIKTTNKISTQGKLLNFKQSYVIKAKKVTVKPPVFRLLSGLEVGTNQTIKANIMFQNRNGNILNGGYDNKGNIFVGYNISLIKF